MSILLETASRFESDHLRVVNAYHAAAEHFRHWVSGGFHPSRRLQPACAFAEALKLALIPRERLTALDSNPEFDAKIALEHGALPVARALFLSALAADLDPQDSLHLLQTSNPEFFALWSDRLERLGWSPHELARLPLEHRENVDPLLP
jgi:hypothetical protein